MTQTDADAKPDREPKRRTGPVTFTKQVVGELRKVRWPTRRELVTYTIVVLVFVVLVLSYVFLLDFVFAELMTWLYTGFSTEDGFQGLSTVATICTAVLGVILGGMAILRSKSD